MHEPAPPPTASAEAVLPDTRLSQELVGFLNQLNGQDCTLGQLTELVGERGFGLLLLVLALPAALPIPAPGYATPFGVLMVILGAQMVRGRTTPWIPEFFAKRNLSHKIVAFSIRNGRFPLRAVELLIRPRLRTLSHSRAFLAGVGVTIMLMAAFMSLPIPLTNTAPSFVIFILAAGILEEDGLMLLGGMLLAPVAAGIAVAAVYVAVTMGPEAVESTVKPFIKGLLGQLEVRSDGAQPVLTLGVGDLHAQRRERGMPLICPPPVRAGLGREAPAHPTNPEVAPPPRVLLFVHGGRVVAVGQRAHLERQKHVQRGIGDVEVEQQPLLARCQTGVRRDHLRHGPGHVVGQHGSRVPIALGVAAPVGHQAHRQRGHPTHRPFPGRRHRARVPDIVADVCAAVDARDDQIRLAVTDVVDAQVDRVRRRAGHRKAPRPLLVDPQRRMQRDRVALGRLFVGWGHRDHVTKIGQGRREDTDPGCVDSVIIAYENEHCWPILEFYGRLSHRRSSAARYDPAPAQTVCPAAPPVSMRPRYRDLFDALLDPDPARTDAAYDAVLFDRAEALPDLEELLNTSPDPLLRFYAIQLMGFTEDKSAVPMVEKALEDPDASVRAEACRALEDLRSRGSVAVLDARLDDMDAKVRRAAREALAVLGGGRRRS